MLRFTLAGIIYAHRGQLRLLLFIGVAFVTAWLAFTSHSAGPNASQGQDKLRPDSTAPPKELPSGARAAVDKNFGRLPLSFEANRGQSDAAAKYIARGPGYNIFLTATEAVLVFRAGDGSSNGTFAEPQALGEESRGGRRSQRLRELLGDADENEKQRDSKPTVLRMRLEGANTAARAIEGVDALPGKSNYFLGNDSSKWVRNVPTYEKVAYREVYPGVDLLFYGNQQQLEYDLVVAPGADPNVIQLKFDGAERLRVDGEGNLLLQTSAGEIRQSKPVIFQDVDGARREIAGNYVLKAGNKVGFKVTRYDRSRPLVIDPILRYVSLVNSGGIGFAITVDADGSAYIAGTIELGENLPATPGAYQQAQATDIFGMFVTKLNPQGNAAVYSTFLGGNGEEFAFAMAVDAGKNAYVTGYTSGSFPTTPGAFQTVRGSAFDGFVTKLNPTGSDLVYSTFFGGNGFDEGDSIVVDAGGTAYIAGVSESTNLATTAGAVSMANGGGFDGYLARLNTTGSAVTYCTYLGGNSYDGSFGVSFDASDNVYVVGQSNSLNFPVVNSLQQPHGGNRGLFKSTGFGTSWALSRNGLGGGSINGLAIDPSNPSIVYAATQGGVWKTIDAGANWTATGVVGGHVYTAAVDPTKSSIVYAGTTFGVYKTVNGGTSWTLMNNGLLPVPQPGDQPARVQAFAIDRNNPTTVYAASFSGMFKTTNGGTSWTAMNTGLTSISLRGVVIDPSNSNILYTASTSRVFRSINAGANWTQVTTGLSTNTLRGLAINPVTPTTLYIGSAVGVFRTTNSGTNWSAINTGLAQAYTDGVNRLPAITAVVVDPINANNVYAAAGYVAFDGFTPTGAYPLTTIFRSTDSGGNWVPFTSGFNGLMSSVLSLAVNPVNPAIVYSGTSGDGEAVVTRISRSGQALGFSSYLGGGLTEYATAVGANAGGDAFISGYTESTDFPTTPGAIQTSRQGATDTFVTRIKTDLKVKAYSTYLGGGTTEDSYGIDVDPLGYVYVTGRTDSVNFPTTAGSFQTKIGNPGSPLASDLFISKIDPAGSALSYSSYLGGAGFEENPYGFIPTGSIKIDSQGNAYVVSATSDVTTFPAINLVNRSADIAYFPFGTFVAKITDRTNTYSITGRLLDSLGSPIIGHVVEAKNAQGVSSIGVTDLQGFYSIINLAAGSYTVTPQKFGPSAHYLFAPTSLTFNGLASDQTANFTGTQLYDIQGRVTSSTVPGLGIFDVTMTLSGFASATVVTDANGNYIFRDLISGNYTVTPSKTGFTFSPNSILLTNITANQTANFTTASAVFFTISGRVADAANTGIGGVTISTVSSPQQGNRTIFVQTDADGNYSIPLLQAGGNYTVTPTKALSMFTPASMTLSNLSGNQIVNFTAAPVTIQATVNTWTISGRTSVYIKLSFADAGYSVTNWGLPVRTGNDFATDAVITRLPGTPVQAVTTTAQIYDLGVIGDGNYTFTFKNSGTVLKTQAFAVSSAVPPPNPIDNSREFVKQQYRDFLNREADPAGEDFWTDNITKCADPARRPPGQTEAQCTLRQRETTSGAFFLSPEFQYTGYYVYRVYLGALGRKPKLSEFTPDAQFVGNGIIVNGQLSGAKINQNKADFAAQFVNCTDPGKYRCAEFKAIYDGLDNTQYVDRLFLNTGVNANTPHRAALVNGLNGETETRATVLQKVVDGINVISEGNQQFTTSYGQAFYDQQLSGAFVQLEYFGYLKRDPDDEGYTFWLGKLNSFGGNFLDAEMVLAFITSPEYRARFGQP